MTAPVLINSSFHRKIIVIIFASVVVVTEPSLEAVSASADGVCGAGCLSEDCGSFGKCYCVNLTAFPLYVPMYLIGLLQFTAV